MQHRSHPNFWRVRLHQGFSVEKFYRDSKLCTIGEGTSEIQKLVISRNILNQVTAYARKTILLMAPPPWYALFAALQKETKFKYKATCNQCRISYYDEAGNFVDKEPHAGTFEKEISVPQVFARHRWPCKAPLIPIRPRTAPFSLRMW